MARIRTIKPAFFRHAALYDAEVETGLPLRVAFVGLWTAADREGRFEWDPRELKLDCLPYDTVDFSRVLDALTTRGFVRRYRVDGREYGWIPSFVRHQVINNREHGSELPAPSEVPEESTSSTRDSRVDDAPATPLVHAQVEYGREYGREGEGRVTDGRVTRTRPQADGALAGTLPRDHIDHGWCGTRFCVRTKHFQELIRQYGGGGDRDVPAWLDSLEQNLKPEESPGGWLWVLQQFEAHLIRIGRLKPPRPVAVPPRKSDVPDEEATERMLRAREAMAGR